jgi:GH25 family lysozyme M1 (1,4-beta-N-acetylmuramidase)
MKQPTCNLGQIVFTLWAVLICLPASVQAQYTIQAGDRVALEWNYNTSNGASNARDINNCNVVGERRPGQDGIARSSRTCVSLSGWNIEGRYFVNNSPQYGTTWTAERLSDGYRLLYPMPGIGARPDVSTGNRSWRVRIFNDISVPVCSSPGGSIQGYKYLGSMGWTLPDQPVSTSSAVWWRVRWDDGTIGWSPDSVAASAYGNPPGVYFAWYNRETRNFQQGCLSVSPSDGLTSSGSQGGSFSPSSKNYILTNTGGQSLNWSVSVDCNWVSVSQSSGTLSPGQYTTVTVSLNSNANSLPPGPYTCTVRFTNTTNGCGNATHEVRLTVEPPPQQGCLSVSPSDGLTSSGSQGGSFSPSSKNYILTNTGGQSLNWSVSVDCNWVSVSQSSGTLSPGQYTTVTVSLNSNANSLPPGPYTCTVRFTNTTNGCGNATHEVRLTVGQSQQPPREAPTLRSPRHRAAGVSIQPTFEWSPVAGATRYGLYIKDVASGQLVFDSDQLNSPITGTSYTLPQNLEPGRLYRWNVRAGNEAGWGPFSEAADFFTVHPQPPADLAVGIDVSSYSGPISVEQFQALRSLGYEFVIVQAWDGTTRNPHASSQIANALRAGMQVAAYCLLKYDPTPNGAQQVDEAIRAIGNDLIRNLSFLAIDVELPQDWRLETNPILRIDNAIRRVREWNLRHVIYTSENNWIRITNNSVEFNGIPLWEARWPNVVNWGFFREQPRFGGRSRRVGWQFQGDVYLTTTEPYNLLVDLNVFDRSFLSGDWQPEPEDESLSTLRLPFERGTFWYVHTYRLSGFVHDPDGCEYAADFYLASAQQANACSRQGNGQDQPIYAAHSGSHYVSIKVFNGKPYYSITVESDNFMTVYVHADIERDGRGVGGAVGSSITVDMLRNRLMRVYPTARSQGNDRYTNRRTIVR